MTRRSLVLLLALAAALTACGTDPPGQPSSSRPAPPADARLTTFSEVAKFALLATEGTPLIDPGELVDAAGYDAIPSVDEPVVVSRAAADAALVESEQVMLVERAGDARAYPVRSLIRHEIVNDVVGGLPVAVTWCPLCNTGITFDRRVEGRTEVFGVSGTLYRSALVMFDRRTQSLWPQPLGKAVLGPLLGAELTVVASSLLPWKQVREAHPDIAVVLGSAEELQSSVNPYAGYDTSARPFLFKGTVDPRLPALERVAGVSFAGQSMAWSYGHLRRSRVVEATIGGQPLVVMWEAGSASPLDSADVRRGRDVGSTGVYDPRVDGRVLTFAAAGPTGFTDDQTSSRWSLAGIAVSGPMQGERLTPLPHQDAFWFAWAAFQPTTGLAER